MKAILLIVILFASSTVAGCGHELFVESEGVGNSRRIDTYYDGDSAVQLRESRRKTSEMGFGYPTGMFEQ